MTTFTVTKSDNSDARRALIADLIDNHDISALVPVGMSTGDFLSVVNDILHINLGRDGSVTYA